MWALPPGRYSALDKLTIQQIEQQAWVAATPRYRDLFGTITWQAVDPVLAALAPLAQQDFLDVACATGELAAAADRRGARAHGVDFAPSMVAAAGQREPCGPWTALGGLAIALLAL